MRTISHVSKIPTGTVFLVLLLFLTSCHYLDDLLPTPHTPENTWTRKTDFPNKPSSTDEANYVYEINVGFSIGSKAYVIQQDSIYEYNPTQDTYAFKITQDIGETEGMVSFVIDSSAYLINSEGDVWEFNPTENTIHQKAAFEGIQRYSAFGFATKDKGYFGGGWISGFITKNDFWEYDPQTDTWTQKADLPDGTRRYAEGVTIGTRGYLMVGITGEFSVNNANDIFPKTIWEYIPENDTWEQRSDFPGVGRQRAVAFSITNKAYLGLGEAPDSLTSSPSLYKVNLLDFYEYNSTTDSWKRIADFPGQGRIRPVGFSVLNKGYAGFGTNNGDPLFDLWQYTP